MKCEKLVNFNIRNHSSAPEGSDESFFSASQRESVGREVSDAVSGAESIESISSMS